MDLTPGFRIGRWTVLPLEGQVCSADGTRRLQPKAMDVLLQLAEKAPHVVSRRDLVDAVWGTRAVSDEPLTRCIGDLRRAFDDFSNDRRIFETIPKRGYRLLFYPEPLDGPDEEGGTVREARSRIPYRSLAVMPFRYLGSDDEMAYLGEGLAEELITALTEYSNVSVAARTSTFTLRDADHNEVREKLGVRYILEGSLAREGDRVRLNVQLVNTESGYQRFAKSIEVAGSGTFTLQDQLRVEVLRSLPASLGSDDSVDIATRHRLGGNAHDAYLRGMRALNIRDLETAASMFGEATSAAPGFAPAHAAYAVTLVLQTRYYMPVDRDKTTDEAERHAQLAIESDASFIKARAAMAIVHMARYEWQEAIDAFQAAIEMNPRETEARLWFGELLILLNDMPAAIHQLELASQFDPLSPLPLRTLAYAHHCMGNSETAERYLESAFAIADESGQFVLQIFTTTILLSQGRIDEACRQLRHLWWLDAISDDDIRATIKAMKAFRSSGQQQPLPDALNDSSVPTVILGRLLAASGNYEQAIRLFEVSFENRDFWAMSFISDPLLAPLRTQSVASDLVARMQNSIGDISID